MTRGFDAVVVGSGPNGLAAAITIAGAGRSVLVIEASETPGGGSRTAEVTLPGFRHDLCSAIHPLGVGSPFFRRLPLGRYGLRWLEPEVQLAHPLDGGTAGLLMRSVEETARSLDGDERVYKLLFGPLSRDWIRLAPSILGPILRVPAHPLALARFGVPALLPATVLARAAFRGDHARALFSGMAAHAMVALEAPLSASFGLVLGAAAHACGWPVAEGGSSAIIDAMLAHLATLGGEIELGRRVTALEALPPARAVLLDVMPDQLAVMGAGSLRPSQRHALERYPRGPGVFKVDYALSSAMPWRAGGAARAGTVHIGGTLDEVAESERLVARGRHAPRPLVIAAQQSVIDPSRAPAGRHTFWAYCHVPNGSTVDMTERIEAQIERFAPGFRDLVLARTVTTTKALERHNPNYLGGDIGGGSAAGLRTLFRPRFTPHPYRTVIPGVYLCSSATPPGGGVHGMCGYHAARDVLARELR